MDHQAKADGVTWDRPDYVRCAVYAGSQRIGVESTAFLGANPGMGGSFVGLLGNLGILRAPSPVTLALRCSHDFRSPGGGVYIEAGALVATRTTNIAG